MAKKFYEIGLMARVKDSAVWDDFETIEWEDDFEKVTDARKKARSRSKECPFKDAHGREVVAIQITCHSDEEGVSSYYLHWSETYVNGKMIRRIDY